MAARTEQSEKPICRAMPLPCLKLCIAAALLMISATCLSAQTEDQVSPVRSTYGITVGTPAALNLTTSQYFGSKLGLRLSGGYLPGHCDSHLAGLQLGVCWKLKERSNSLFDAGLVFGYTEIENGRTAMDDELWRYMGVTGSYQWRSFFIEGGLTVGSGTHPNPQGVLQVGFIFKTSRH